MALKALIGDTVLSKDNKIVDVASLLPSGGVLGLYFSAHWCPPCRAFTPELAEWYNNIKQGPNGSKFEIVFVSCDSDEESFGEYFAEMPWHAVPFSDRETESKLSKKFNISGIPTLVFLDSDGTLITDDGRSIVMDDPQGSSFFG